MSGGEETVVFLSDRPQWTDISVSDIPPLPKLPKHVTTSNPRFLARSHHSHVYLLDVTVHGETSPALVKLFPKLLRQRYINEVDAYRFLYYFNVPESGIVPKIHGVLPSINKKALQRLLGDSIPEDAPIATPAAGVVMEYIQGAQPASQKNMTPTIAQAAVDGLRAINNAHVLHGDAEARNLMVFPDTGRIVWIDFSSASINRDIMVAAYERDLLKELLYRRLVSPCL